MHTHEYYEQIQALKAVDIVVSIREGVAEGRLVPQLNVLLDWGWPRPISMHVAGVYSTPASTSRVVGSLWHTLTAPLHERIETYPRSAYTTATRYGRAYPMRMGFVANIPLLCPHLCGRRLKPPTI